MLLMYLMQCATTVALLSAWPEELSFHWLKATKSEVNLELLICTRQVAETELIHTTWISKHIFFFTEVKANTKMGGKIGLMIKALNIWPHQAPRYPRFSYFVKQEMQMTEFNDWNWNQYEYEHCVFVELNLEPAPFEWDTTLYI